MNITARKNIKRSIIAGLAIAATTIFIAAPASAYQCKPSYRIGVGKAFVKTIAKNKARKTWSSSTKAAHGVPWSLWNIAASRSVNCSKDGAKWRCAAYAKPCLYVVP